MKETKANSDYTLIGTEKEWAQLPLSEHFQNAVIGWMEVDDRFFKVVIDKIEPHWFMNLGNSYIFELYKKWYENYHQHPRPYVDEQNRGEIQCWEEWTLLEPSKKRLAAPAFLTARKAKDSCLQKVLLEEMEAWCKSRVYHKLIDESGKLYNQGLFKKCFEIVRQRVNEIDKTSFSLNEAADLKLKDLVDERNNEYRDALHFGIHIVDEALLDAAKTNPAIGGLLPGDTTILLAPVNVGKTTTMLTVLTHNLRMGNKILLTTHEGRESDIKMKLWCSLLKCSQTQLIEYWDTYRNVPVPNVLNEAIKGQTIPEGKLHLYVPSQFDSDRVHNGKLTMEQWQRVLQKKLIYVPMNISGGTIEETVSKVRLFNDYSKQVGDPIKIWVDDYPGTITTAQAQHGKLTRRERDEIVYGQVVDLAGELKIHALCAIQSNREGAKINKKISDDRNRLLTMEDVSESYGPMMRATNVISINRDPISSSKGFVTFYVCKSRSSKTGIAVVCKSRYDLHVTHSEFHPDIKNLQGTEGDFGGYWYEGTESHSDKAEGFLRSHMANELPYRELIEALSADNK